MSAIRSMTELNIKRSIFFDLNVFVSPISFDGTLLGESRQCFLDRSSHYPGDIEALLEG